MPAPWWRPHRAAWGGPKSAAPPRAEAGGIALLTVCGGLVLLLVGALVLSAATEVGLAAARARTAADAAALAGATAGCTAAGELAEANGAHLTTCRVPAAGSAVVEVAAVPPSAHVRRLVGELPARAAAILEPPGAAPPR